ncbi:MAG TPA: hypothetical protein VEH07_00600 [Alphaproteobacteria bacterium]|nr:hypothetical protein [Alphaproteobacteria bacterium]
MASRSNGPDENMGGLGLIRLSGYALLALAAFVGYFHTKAWLDATHSDSFNAISGAIGTLLLCALVPLSAIVIARRHRDAEFSKLEAYATELYNMLVNGSAVLATRDIINQMIAVYGVARELSARIGWFLIAGLSLSILICALYADHLAEQHVFTHNQANLLVAFMLMSAFGLWCLLWPEDEARANQFDPSDVLASAIGR